MYGVIALTVFVDLITAVAIGVFIANVLTIARMEKLQNNAVKAIHDANPEHDHDLSRDEQTLLEQANGKILVFALGGPLLFGVAKAISRKYAVLSSHEILIVDFTRGTDSRAFRLRWQWKTSSWKTCSSSARSSSSAPSAMWRNDWPSSVCCNGYRPDTSSSTRQEALTQATALLEAKRPETGERQPGGGRLIRVYLCSYSN